MNSLWWLALPLLALPILWHRHKQVQNAATPLATARFLPRAEPHQTRVWRWRDLVLLLLRCLLLASLIAWLADPVYPWRGDTVLVAEGTDETWVAQQIGQDKLSQAERVTLAAPQVLSWLHSHEREWKADARILVLGDVPMPATKPQFARAVEVRSHLRSVRKSALRVHIASDRPLLWKRMFGALAGDVVVAFDATPGSQTSLVIWDRATPPPADWRAPLWLATERSAFAELADAPLVDGLRVATSGRGRLWHNAAWPPATALEARALLEQWQQLHRGPRQFTLAAQTFTATAGVAAPEPSGALRDTLLLVLIGLFVLERSLTHARRR